MKKLQFPKASTLESAALLTENRTSHLVFQNDTNSYCLRDRINAFIRAVEKFDGVGAPPLNNFIFSKLGQLL